MFTVLVTDIYKKFYNFSLQSQNLLTSATHLLRNYQHFKKYSCMDNFQDVLNAKLLWKSIIYPW